MRPYRYNSLHSSPSTAPQALEHIVRILAYPRTGSQMLAKTLLQYTTEPHTMMKCTLQLHPRGKISPEPAIRSKRNPISSPNRFQIVSEPRHPSLCTPTLSSRDPCHPRSPRPHPRPGLHFMGGTPFEVRRVRTRRDRLPRM